MFLENSWNYVFYFHLPPCKSSIVFGWQNSKYAGDNNTSGDIDIEGGLVCLQIYELVCEKYIFNSEFCRNKTYFKNLIYRVSIVTALLEYSDNLPTDREENNDVALNLGKAGSYAKEIKEIEKWENQERKRVSVSCSCCFPDCWKVSSVVHVFKNVGERSAAKNYRPDSKVFEKLVSNSIVGYLEKCGLFFWFLVWF